MGSSRPPQWEPRVTLQSTVVEPEAPETVAEPKPLRLSGSQPFTQAPNVYIMSFGDR
jgi:hypothetical protein